MRIVALEEHFSDPTLVAGYFDQAPGSPSTSGWPAHAVHGHALAHVGEERIADMDKSGLTQQVLSASGLGAELLDSVQGPKLAVAYNDRLKAIITGNPTRFAGFAHLPMTNPEAAADELERCVTQLGFCGGMANGTTGGLFLDDARFEPLLARAEALDVPIYIHPNVPVDAVKQAYFSGLPGGTSTMLAGPGWGWHSETAIHVLRLVVSGALEKHPKLKLIIGHMGEGLPAMLTRCDDVFTRETQKYLSRTVSQTILDQLWITTSALPTLPPFMAALLTFGADRILFSVDYPFTDNTRATNFLRALPVSPDDRAKIAHGNADRLLKLGSYGKT